MRIPIAMALLCCAGMAAGQSYDAYTVPAPGQFDFIYDMSTAPSVAVGFDGILVAGTHRLSIFDKASPSTGPIATVSYEQFLPDAGFTGYPFVPASPTGIQFASMQFPRADFDPHSGALWMLMTEDRSALPETGSELCRGYLHLAVQREDGVDPYALTDFAPANWWYYTGPAGTAPRPAFDLTNFALARYKLDPNHFGLDTSLLMPSMGFDEQAIVVAATAFQFCSDNQPEIPSAGPGDQFIYIIPRTHDGGTKSILNGDRPSESDITVIRLDAEEPGIFKSDLSAYNLVVQEPHEQYPNVTLLIGTDGADFAGGPQDRLRLKGVFDADPSQSGVDWTLRQRVKVDTGQPDGYALEDMVFATLGTPSGAFLFRQPNEFQSPAAKSFDPTVEGDYFTSAVLTRDAAGEPRVFAVHAADDVVNLERMVQWYVIDPDLDDFINPANPEDWQPEVLAVGRIDTDLGSEPVAGECYLPAIAVTRSGTAYIEYTFSSATVDQKVIRAKIGSSTGGYYDVVDSAVVVRQGPDNVAYSLSTGFDNRWALYPDMQADPYACPIWSTHTLVHGQSAPSPIAVDERDVWLNRIPLFGIPGSCNTFTTDLNANMMVDPGDALLFDSFYAARDPRADADASGEVDPVDAAIFLDRYSAGQP